MPFGASISCAHFQAVSNAIAHIIEVRIQHKVINYLDDFLFVAAMKIWVDGQMKAFMEICQIISFPVSEEKTVFGNTKTVFLGLLLDSENRIVCVPKEKVRKALNLIKEILNNEKSKATVKQIQQVCGYLNFLSRSIIPGLAFTRHLYALIGGKEVLKNQQSKLKQHHHIWVKSEQKRDLEMWCTFLSHQSVFCRHFTDFSRIYSPEETTFHTDAAKSSTLGCGGWCERSWFCIPWGNFVTEKDPSIAYLELFGLTVGAILCFKNFKNKRIWVNCDNQAVVQMVNNSTSGCRNCMVLIRLLTLECLVHNMRVHACYISSQQNGIADALSRLDGKRFLKLTQNMNMNTRSEPIPEAVWPIRKVWVDY